MSLPTPRPYQLRAVKAVMRELRYRDSTLIVQATGTGKSVVQGALARLLLMRGRRRVLVTAPRTELLEQCAAWALRWKACRKEEVGFEQGQRRAHPGHKIIYATTATLRDRERRAAMPAWDAAIHDEAHIETEFLRELADEAPTQAVRVGMTATPDRSDLDRLLPYPFEAIHPDAIYEILDAVGDGHLAPVEGLRARIGALDLGRVKVGPDGDFVERSLSAAMRDPAVVDQVARVVLDQARGQTLIFATNIAHAEALLERLRAWAAAPAAIAHGKLATADRRQVLEDFAAGRVRYLLTVALLTYGWDCPVAETAVMARPTTSRALYTQSIGRVLRPHPSKASALVLDLWGGSDELELVTPDEAMLPNPELPAARRRRLATAPEEAPADDEASIDVDVDRGLARDADVPDEPPEAAYQLEALNDELRPLGLELETEGGGALTRRTRDELDRQGVELELTEDQAQELLEKMDERRRQGRATWRQMHLLARMGLWPDVDFETASEAIDKIAENGWRVPPALRLKLQPRGSSPIAIRGRMV